MISKQPARIRSEVAVTLPARDSIFPREVNPAGYDLNRRALRHEQAERCQSPEVLIQIAIQKVSRPFPLRRGASIPPGTPPPRLYERRKLIEQGGAVARPIEQSEKAPSQLIANSHARVEEACHERPGASLQSRKRTRYGAVARLQRDGGNVNVQLDNG
ncbi:MAG TPA: hypothetical protein VKC34_12935, partial [Blastocatellia bacterium]|nr:hypothetical protein [Blastocatellia bacterium]